MAEPADHGQDAVGDGPDEGGELGVGGGHGDVIRVAVGTEVTPRPPHRSVRAELPHTAPASGM